MTSNLRAFARRSIGARFSRNGARHAGMGIVVALLILLGSGQAAAATIYCGYDQGGCTASGYYFVGAGRQSNTWQFFDNYPGGPPYGNLVYSFEIAGTPGSTFALDVTDTWSYTAADFIGFTYQGISVACVENDTGYCTFFEVTAPLGVPSWLGDYDVTILWYAPVGQIPGDHITILRDATFSFLTAVALMDIWYDPLRSPGDPGIGGRGNTFSVFGVFEGEGLPQAQYLAKPVPEPASMLLLGTGLAGLAARARRRRR